MSWVHDKPKQYRRKPPVVKAFQFDVAGGAANWNADQYLRCYYSADTYSSRPSPHFSIEHDSYMDWVTATIYVDGKKFKASERAKRIEIGYWIVINEIEDTVEFLSDHQFKARYEEIS